METIFLNLPDYAEEKNLYAALKLLLDLPDFFGENADALYDCLSERGTPVNLWIRGSANDGTAAALRKITRVFADLDGEVKEL